jgi:hypothetical protein
MIEMEWITCAALHAFAAVSLPYREANFAGDVSTAQRIGRAALRIGGGGAALRIGGVEERRNEMIRHSQFPPPRAVETYAATAPITAHSAT